MWCLTEGRHTDILGRWELTWGLLESWLLLGRLSLVQYRRMGGSKHKRRHLRQHGRWLLWFIGLILLLRRCLMLRRRRLIELSRGWRLVHGLLLLGDLEVRNVLGGVLHGRESLGRVHRLDGLCVLGNRLLEAGKLRRQLILGRLGLLLRHGRRFLSCVHNRLRWQGWRRLN